MKLDQMKSLLEQLYINEAYHAYIFNTSKENFNFISNENVDTSFITKMWLNSLTQDEIEKLLFKKLKGSGLSSRKNA